MTPENVECYESGLRERPPYKNSFVRLQVAMEIRAVADKIVKSVEFLERNPQRLDGKKLNTIGRHVGLLNAMLGEYEKMGGRLSATLRYDVDEANFVVNNFIYER